MGTRSNKRKYRRRRQRAGFVLFVSLVIVVLGGVLFFRMDPFQETSSELMGRVEAPAVSEAPRAVAEGVADEAAEDKEKATAEKEERKQEQKEERKKEQAAAEQEPAVPLPATNDIWLTVPKLGL
jgi:hypothetical protein